jgi:hypothetical protein
MLHRSPRTTVVVDTCSGAVTVNTGRSADDAFPIMEALPPRTPSPQQQIEALLVRDDGLELVEGIILEEMRQNPIPNGIRYQRMIKKALRWKREQFPQPLAMSE